MGVDNRDMTKAVSLGEEIVRVAAWAGTVSGSENVRFDVKTLDSLDPLSVVNVYRETDTDNRVTVVVVLRPEVPKLTVGRLLGLIDEGQVEVEIDVEVDGVRRGARHVVFEDGKIVLTDRRHSG